MEQTITRFVHALRNAEVEVSPAETLDAIDILYTIGCTDLNLFKSALSMALAKSPEDKSRYNRCFDEFFGLGAFSTPPKESILKSVDKDALVAAIRGEDTEAAEIAEQVLKRQAVQLNARLSYAAREAGLYELQHLREKGPLQRKIGQAFGLAHMQAAQGGLQGDLRTGVAYISQYLKDEIKAFVDQQYDLVAAEPAKKVILDRALAATLAQIPKDYEAELHDAIETFAEKLKNRHRRRRRQARRGTLNVREMLRRNMAYDGAMVELAFKRKKREEGTLFLLCDVSGSVGQVSRLLLLITHHLHELLPNVRSFAFSNVLGEVSDYFESNETHKAVERVLFDWSGGNTDYGRAFVDFRNLVHQDLNSRSTLIVLGDARSNFYPAHIDVFREITHRCRRTLWFNPEPRDQWTIGDSDMASYAPFCSEIERVSTLSDLRRVATQLVATQP